MRNDIMALHAGADQPVDEDREPWEQRREPRSSDQALAAAVAAQRYADHWHRMVLVAAAEYGAHHPPEPPGAGEDPDLPGDLSPRTSNVCEYAAAEFAAAMGMRTGSGMGLLSDAVELSTRLPKTWARVTLGSLKAWRARMISAQTVQLSDEAAAFVDDQVHESAGQLGERGIKNIVGEALAQFMPAEAAQAAAAAAEARRVDVDLNPRDPDPCGGVTRFSGCLDLRDARDLHAALIAGAETMKARAKDEGLDIEPLEVRKSRVMGDMARAYLGWLADDNDHGQLRGLPRDLNLYVHLNLTDLLGPSRLGLARVANEGDRLITAEQVRRWAGEPGTKVVVKPVIDLAEHVRVTQYEVPDRVKERVHLRDGTCVFPHCTRPAHRCDTDHSEAYNHAEPDSGGATCPCNLAPLCRRHHNLKTHHGWRYRRISSEGNDLRPVYLWTSPGGRSYLRDERGTASLQ